MDEKIRQLYLKAPTLYSFYSIEELNCDKIIEGDALLLKDKDNIFSYHFVRDFYKVNFKNGFKTILLNEIMYDKFKTLISNSCFNYQITKYVKCLKNGTGDVVLEINNINEFELHDNTSYKMIIYKGIYKEEDVSKYSLFDILTIWYKFEMIPNEHINSYEDLKNKLKEISILGKKPSLLLHSCCGPCSSYILQLLSNYFDITILYYNPNIYPVEEYNLRLETQKNLIKLMGLDIEVIDLPYNHIEYLLKVKGLEDLPEKSKRCYNCYKFRMELTARMAKGKYDYFTTTISISPYKVSRWLNEIGKELEGKYKVNYLYSDFKLENGYNESIKLSKKYNIYRQEYCGCEFTMPKID